MKRRKFITLVGGAVASPLVARAQQPTGARRIGVLMNFASDASSEGRARLAAFTQALQKLGWNEGDNVRTDIRWAGDDIERIRKYSEELVGLHPDVIVASGSGLAALQRTTRSVPIVFVNLADPVGAGYVRSLARPGGNTTGFISFEYSIAGKWLELLKQMGRA
jgi:putative ABC transport system substrate-binding protein